ncbi:uncharacterized protein G2W53_041160 [Senna tora]|uniref:Uncharacterized protein n=1 Tax=Senna tora TaxID=362788 RepID=A0A834SRH3_9FABA|nr:uncharacterized protein G2W53_041160 [Senna tora]
MPGVRRCSHASHPIKDGLLLIHQCFADAQEGRLTRCARGKSQEQIREANQELPHPVSARLKDFQA